MINRLDDFATLLSFIFSKDNINIVTFFLNVMVSDKKKKIVKIFKKEMSTQNLIDTPVKY